MKKIFFKINKDIILYDVVRIQLFEDLLYVGSSLLQNNYIITELSMIDHIQYFVIYYEDKPILHISKVYPTFGAPIYITNSHLLVIHPPNEYYWKIRRWFLKLLNEEYEEKQ